MKTLIILALAASLAACSQIDTGNDGKLPTTSAGGALPFISLK